MNINRQFPILLVLAAAVLVCCHYPARAVASRPEPHNWFEWVISYPYQTQEDMRHANREIQRLISFAAAPSDGAMTTTRMLQTLVEYTDVRPGGAESVEIVSFTRSNNKAIRRLREQIGLPPPQGGAIVRVYNTREDMPPGIREMFRGDAAGITFMARYVAMWTGNRTDQEREDILSHELTHAYVSTLVGGDHDRLPKWFHEGTALYLSGGQVQYISFPEYGRTVVSYSPADYNEWRRVFRYLEDQRGPEAVDEFIAGAVSDLDAAGALQEVFGIGSYKELVARADAAYQRRQIIIALLVVAPFVLGGAYAWIRRRMIAAEIRGEDEEWE